MQEKTQLTKTGLEDLQNEYRTLLDVTREEIKKQLEEARAQGDLSENADYDAARNRQSEVEARIRELEVILHNYEIINDKPKTNTTVALGSTIKVTFLDSKKTAQYKIVGTVESNPFKGLISNDSPLGIAVIGKHKNDIVEVKGKLTYSIRIDDIMI